MQSFCSSFVMSTPLHRMAWTITKLFSLAAAVVSYFMLLPNVLPVSGVPSQCHLPHSSPARRRRNLSRRLAKFRREDQRQHQQVLDLPVSMFHVFAKRLWEMACQVCMSML